MYPINMAFMCQCTDMVICRILHLQKMQSITPILFSCSALQCMGYLCMYVQSFVLLQWRAQHILSASTMITQGGCVCPHTTDLFLH
uniref:Uncharacterized protein n=1 Tax=Pyxicephalus adspersus TaxID=30357 RepID=A0AAV3ARZ4_PYXAD|nr:TPA: hypothetical protein GDO54_005989 [Pyxicephalus adspersus]